MNQPGKLIVFSGAGISAESGVPTFRTGNTALWRGMDVNVVCNYSTWKANRSIVHDFYNGLRNDLASVQPNPMHTYQAKWQREYGARLLTQNVDDLLERAGASDVVHLHGQLTQMLCTACGNRWEIGYRSWNHEAERCTRKRCNSSRGVKPDVVFFGENANQYLVLKQTINAIKPNDTVVVTGTRCDVVPFDLMLAGVPGYKIFNSINPGGELGVERLKVFDLVLDCSASLAAPRIQAILEERGMVACDKAVVSEQVDSSSIEYVTDRHMAVMCGEVSNDLT